MSSVAGVAAAKSALRTVSRLPRQTGGYRPALTGRAVLQQSRTAR